MKMEGKNSRYQLLIPEYVFNDLNLYVKGCSREIGGVGHIKINSQFELFLTKLAPLFKRTTTSVSVEPSPQEYAKYVSSFSEEKQEEEVRSIRFYWHSHPGMSTRPSSTDEDSIHNLTVGKGWIIWMILNQKGECNIFLEVASNNPKDQLILRIPIEIVVIPREEEIKREIQEKILNYSGKEGIDKVKEFVGIKG